MLNEVSQSFWLVGRCEELTCGKIPTGSKKSFGVLEGVIVNELEGTTRQQRSFFHFDDVICAIACDGSFEDTGVAH